MSEDAQQEAKALVKKAQAQIASLEDALAATTEMLLTYKDYYGTSITQVKHLQECTACYLGIDAEEVRCFDYPAE